MITPVNGHIVIEPVEHTAFIASSTNTYEEIGTVIAVCDSVTKVSPGDKVYFDAWLAAKYPKSPTEYYWLVKWEDVRAIVHAESKAV